MSHAAPAVVLLFDDVEQVGQLREALNDCGARIVHEGGVSSISRELLEKVGAQVLVVNLDDSAADALDRLYEAIDGDRPRVVFNDAQASRELTGWDRARWARHLAVKVLELGDLDPPRPEHARGVELITSETLEAAIALESAADPVPLELPAAEAEAEEGQAGDTIEQGETSSLVLESPSFESEKRPPAPFEHLHGDGADEEPEDMAAELEALLASAELSMEEETPTGSGLRFTGDEDLPPLHDGHFGPLAVEPSAADADSPQRPRAGATVQDDAGPRLATAPVFQLDHLELTPLTDTAVVTAAAAAEHVPVDALAARTRVPEGWSLLQDDVEPAASSSAEKPEAADFGIQKISASEFLAPDADQASANDHPVMSLQLVSMEEAVAPIAFEKTGLARANDLSQIVLLGAASASTESVCRFLTALPVTTKLAIVHTQHLGSTPVEALVRTLAAHSALPVHVAKHGSRAKAGEVLVVPAGQELILIRDGGVELMPSGANAAQGPSIDASFSMAADVFGRDALAIVFSGRGTDAVAGAQAVHDRGGKVWVQSLDSAHPADMVSGISAERLVSFSGTPHELAAHLIEVFP